MPDPGYDVILVDAPAPRGAPTATDAAFFLDFAGEGPTNAPQLIESPDQADRIFGAVQPAWSGLQDDLDAFFASGGARAYVQRVTGPTAIAASADVSGTTGNTLKITANDVGAFANTGGLTYEFANGATSSSRVLTIKRNGVVVARSAEQTSRDGFVGKLGPVTITAGSGSGLPTVITATNLAGGTDDHTNATISGDWAAALGKMAASFGPGQVHARGLTTSAGHQLLAAHAFTNGRFAVLTAPRGADDVALASLSASTIAGADSRFAALWRDWAVVPGRLFGSTRVVPWSAIQCGLIAASDALTGNPNREAAGENGIASYVISVEDEVSADRRATLKTAQVNTVKTVYGEARAYGQRTLADLTKIPHWSNVGGSRTVMAARALMGEVDESEVFGQLDGRRQALALYGGKLTGVLAPLWGTDGSVGALYGESLADALSVDVGPTVNTTDTIKLGQKLARVTLKTSPNSEHVVTYLARVAVDQAL